MSTDKSKSNDPGWNHCSAVGPGKNIVQCNYCDKIMKSGITRAKEHLIGKRGKVAPCKDAPANVRTELLAYYKAKNDEKRENTPKDIDLGFGFNDEEDEPIVVRHESGTSSGATKKGTIEMFLTKQASTKEKGRQTNIREVIDKEAVARVHQYIARFWYQAGISFNCITLDSFQDMLNAVGAYGKHLPAPTYHGIRVPLLKKELEHTNNLLQKNKDEWCRHGCSIMSDGWTDRKQRTIINFLVNSPSGTVFVKSIDGSGFVKTGEKLFELLDELVEEIGEENVVQVVSDNGSNYVSAGKMLMEKRQHLYWTPCAAHCIDLILEDIGKLHRINMTIKRGVKFVGFIYNHTSTLSLMRRFTNKRELVRPAVTRFATSYLSLERIHKEKGNLRKMFTSEEWAQNKLSKDAKGKQATNIALMPSFWKNVVYTLKVMAPLVRVLRLVDGEKKPAMGYIYEAMEKAKEAIAKSFQNDESRYKEVFSIIDNRWDCQLHRPLHAAGHFLNPDIFYDNKKMEFDMEVTNGLYDSIRRLVPNRDVQDKILGEMESYKSRGGLFGSDFAERQRKKIAPAQWWRMYGHSAPNLQQLAIKILGLTCSASGCERNWSVFEQVFGEIAEGLETLTRINEAYVDEKNRPYKNIRIKHTYILDDPFEDPPLLTEMIPDASPEGKPKDEVDDDVRLEDDWIPMDEQLNPQELQEVLSEKAAHTSAVLLETIGDIPLAESKPPDNVLFVCKLNPVTEDEDLHTIFSRFGVVTSAEVIRDHKTGDSLCYAFIEFEDKDACEEAYFKMDNALIDDRRIHVDFSQSVAKLWSQFKDKGRVGGGGGCFKCGSVDHIAKDCSGDPATRQPPHSKFMLKDDNTQRGGDRSTRYEMVFDEDDGGPRHSKKRRDHKAEQYEERQNNKQRDAYKPKYEDERRRDAHDLQRRRERSKGREDESYAPKYEDERRRDAHDLQRRHERSKGREDEGYARRQISPHRRGSKDYMDRNDRDEREHRRRNGSGDGQKKDGDDAGYGHKGDASKYEKKLVDDVGRGDRKNESEIKKRSHHEDQRGSHRDRHDVGDDKYGHKRRGEERQSDKRSSKGDDYRDRTRRH